MPCSASKIGACCYSETSTPAATTGWGSASWARRATRLASFDRNGDGQVTAAELPHRFELSFSQASSPLAFVVRSDLDDAAADAPRPVSAAGPHWFQKMDRNHDGDVSFREFLGPNEAFLRLDADGDGLIDVHEAAAARPASEGP